MEMQSFTADELSAEQWRDVVGYEGVYSVSDLGRVRREKAAAGTAPGRIRSLRKDKDGYLVLNLWNGNKKTKTCKVHIMVAQAFLEPDKERPFVNHKDGVKSNARLSNLEWATDAENRKHASRTGLMATGDRNGSRKRPETRPRGEKNGMNTHPESRLYGEKNHNAVLTAEKVRKIKEMREAGLSYGKLAAMFGVKKAAIYKVLTGRSWRHVTLISEL